MEYVFRGVYVIIAAALLLQVLFGTKYLDVGTHVTLWLYGIVIMMLAGDAYYYKKYGWVKKVMCDTTTEEEVTPTKGSSLKDTVQMDADTTFITNLPLLDDKTTTITMVDEPKMSIFGCLYSYLQTLPLNWSLIFGAFTTVYIFLNGVFTLFQANSVPLNSKSVNCLKPKCFKRSFNLFMPAVFLVNSIAMGVQVQVQAPLQQVSLYHFPTMTYYLHMYTNLLFVMYFYFRL